MAAEEEAKQQQQHEVEEEYESDVDDDVPLSTMRRRAAASDDEDGDEPAPPVEKPGSDEESDGQGAPEVYEDEVDKVYDEEEEEEYEEVEQKTREVVVVLVPPEEEEQRQDVVVGQEQEDVVGQEGEGKKGSEPFAVPTAGAFYMHDDRERFAENGRRGGGRPRRMFGGRKLWNPKDDTAWVHDRFDEMTLQESHYHDQRSLRARFRGRGGRRGRGNDRMVYRPRNHPDDGKARNYPDDGKARNYRNDGRPRNYPDNGKPRYYPDDGKYQHNNARNNGPNNGGPKIFRGRGRRRYQRWKIVSETSEVQNNKLHKPQETAANSSAGKHSSQASNVQFEQNPPRKQIFASNLNSDSPPFYPSRSSYQEFPVVQQREAQTDSTSKPLSSFVDSNLVQQSSPLLRGNNPFFSAGHHRFVDNSLQTVIPKNVASFPLNSSTFRGQERGLGSGGSTNGQFASATHQAPRVSTLTQAIAVGQRAVQAPIQSAPHMAAQMTNLQVPNVNPMPSSPKLTSASLAEETENVSPLGSNKSKALTTVKEKTCNQGTETGSFPYGGAHVLGDSGPMGLTLGDQGYPGTPALLPVMQFGGQHPAGSGAPALGMALPGYVAQQQLGLRNSEMTWLPVLTGAAGAFGASYCPPYIALDGSYYPRPTGQASSSVSSRETGLIKASGSARSQEMSRTNEVVNDELGQRQNKPRRYSEMNFG